jgi:hypothetical protein
MRIKIVIFSSIRIIIISKNALRTKTEELTSATHSLVIKIHFWESSVIYISTNKVADFLEKPVQL